MIYYLNFFLIHTTLDICLLVLHLNFVDLPLDEKLSMFNHNDPLQWGFHPKVPEALTNHGAKPN